MAVVRTALLLTAAALLGGCAGTAWHRVEAVRTVPAAPACASPGGSALVVETTLDRAPAGSWPVYDRCPFCGGATAFSVDSTLDLHCYTCRSCPTIVYGWRDGAAWAQQRDDEGLRAWRLHGTRAVPVECVPFETPRTLAVRNDPAPVTRRAPARSRDRGRAYDSGGGFLVASAVRMTGHPTGLPGHPTGLPAASVTRSSHPVALPSHPTGLPASPVERPSHPVTRPAAPVALPSHPVALPAAPVGRSSHPVERASHPLVPLATASQRASAGTGRSSGARNPLDGVLFNRGRGQ